jgi:hypothetical protein
VGHRCIQVSGALGRPLCHPFQITSQTRVGFSTAFERVTRYETDCERLFVEERRRLNIIPNAFGERGVLTFGALITASRPRGVRSMLRNTGEAC